MGLPYERVSYLEGGGASLEIQTSRGEVGTRESSVLFVVVDRLFMMYTQWNTYVDP